MTKFDLDKNKQKLQEKIFLCYRLNFKFRHHIRYIPQYIGNKMMFKKFCRKIFAVFALLLKRYYRNIKKYGGVCD